MRNIDTVQDSQGHDVVKGDTVALLSDNTSARVAELATDGETAFLRLRPLHQPYGKGVWHAADEVVWLAASKRSRTEKDKEKEKEKAGSGSS